MATRRHGSARTMPRIRAELQRATGSHRSLGKLYGSNPKTVAKWRGRTSVLDEPMCPRDTASVRSQEVMVHSSAQNRREHYGNPPAWQRPKRLHAAIAALRCAKASSLRSLAFFLGGVRGVALRYMTTVCSGWVS